MGAYVKAKVGGEGTDLNSAPKLTDEDGKKIANDDNQFTNAVLAATVGLATDSGPNPIGLYAKGEIGVEGFFGSSNSVDSFVPVTATDCGFLGTGTTDCGEVNPNHQMDGTAALHGLAFVLQATAGGRFGPVRAGAGVNFNYRGYLDSLAPVSRTDQDGNDVPSSGQAEIKNTLSPIGFNFEAEYLTPKARANTGGSGFSAEVRFNPWGNTEAFDGGDQIGPITLTSPTTNLQVTGAYTYYFGTKGASDDSLSATQLDELRARAEKDEKADLTKTLAEIAKDQDITVEALLAQAELKAVDVVVTTEEVHGQSGEAVAMRSYGQPSLTFVKYYYATYTDDALSAPGHADADKAITKDELVTVLKSE
jgi:hypothetical protein